MSMQQAMSNVMEETAHLPEPEVTLSVRELAETEKNEVIAFLSERPIHKGSRFLPDVRLQARQQLRYYFSSQAERTKQSD